MKAIWFKAVPFDKTLVTLALESGVDGLVVEAEHVEAVKALGRVEVVTPADLASVTLASKADEDTAVAALKAGRRTVLTLGWEIIPVENILAQSEGLGVEAAGFDQARLAAGILERGVDWILVTPEAAHDLKKIVAEVKLSQGRLDLAVATAAENLPAIHLYQKHGFNLQGSWSSKEGIMLVKLVRPSPGGTAPPCPATALPFRALGKEPEQP